jgi:hypothetical protein
MRTARQVPINFFVMPGWRVREHFSSYAREAYVDEARLRVQAGRPQHSRVRWAPCGLGSP